MARVNENWLDVLSLEETTFTVTCSQGSAVNQCLGSDLPSLCCLKPHSKASIYSFFLAKGWGSSLFFLNTYCDVNQDVSGNSMNICLCPDSYCSYCQVHHHLAGGEPGILYRWLTRPQFHGESLSHFKEVSRSVMWDFSLLETATQES